MWKQTKEKLGVMGHRGCCGYMPENTLISFREAFRMGVDFLEFDVQMTRDGHLVVIHDSMVNRTTDGTGAVNFMTLEELKQYNFGYYFEDANGQRIYKDAENFEEMGLQIATVDQLFAEFYQDYPDLMFIVEIKNKGEQGKEAARILSETLEQYPGYKDQIVIGTFHPEIENELKEKYPHLLRGASTGSARNFVLTQYLGVNLFDNSDFSCLQIPLSYDIGVEIRLDTKTLIRRAHRRGIAVQYWTINDADEMRMLIEMGVDCIMTDDPMLMKQVLEEYRTGNP